MGANSKLSSWDIHMCNNRQEYLVLTLEGTGQGIRILWIFFILLVSWSHLRNILPYSLKSLIHID